MRFRAISTIVKNRIIELCNSSALVGLAIMVYELLYYAIILCSPNIMVTVRVCSKIKNKLKIGCFYK